MHSWWHPSPYQVSISDPEVASQTQHASEMVGQLVRASPCANPQLTQISDQFPPVWPTSTRGQWTINACTHMSAKHLLRNWVVGWRLAVCRLINGSTEPMVSGVLPDTERSRCPARHHSYSAHYSRRRPQWFLHQRHHVSPTAPTRYVYVRSTVFVGVFRP